MARQGFQPGRHYRQQYGAAETREEMCVCFAVQAAPAKPIRGGRADIDGDAVRRQQAGPDNKGTGLAERHGAAILPDQL